MDLDAQLASILDAKNKRKHPHPATGDKIPDIVVFSDKHADFLASTTPAEFDELKKKEFSTPEERKAYQEELEVI